MKGHPTLILSADLQPLQRLADCELYAGHSLQNNPQTPTSMYFGLNFYRKKN